MLSDEDINRRIAAMNAIQNAALPEPNVPDRIDVNDVYGPVQERVLEIENVPPERPTYAAGTYTDPYNVNYPERVEVVGGTGMVAFNAPDAPTSVSAGDFTTRQRDKVYGSPRAGKTRGLSSAENMADEPSAVSQSMNPMQDDWGDIQRPKGFVEKYGKYVPNVFAKAAVKGYGYVEDKKWSNMSPEERLAQLSRGVRPTGAPSGMGQDNDRSKGPDFTTQQDRKTNQTASVPKNPNKKRSGPRPAVYYKWDLGVEVPSPTDSGYPLYLKYLEERAAAKAAV
jgi:hypothetical protein